MSTEPEPGQNGASPFGPTADPAGAIVVGRAWLLDPGGDSTGAAPVRDAAIERALAFFLDRKSWKPSKLAKESGVPVCLVHQAVQGYAPAVATLRRLSNALGVEILLAAVRVTKSEEPTS